MPKKSQSEIIAELQHNSEAVILNNPLSAPKFIRKLGKNKQMSLTEIYTPKLFYDIISRITPEHLQMFEEGRDVATLTLNIGEFLKSTNTGNSKSLYRHVIDCIDLLQTTQVKWTEGENERGTAIITDYTYFPKQGKIEVVLYKEFVKQVVSVTQNEHFSFLKQYLYRLQNAQAIRLFPFFVSWRNRGMVEVELDTFKKKFSCDTEGYKFFNNLRKKVLEPAIAEINEKTNLYITYNPLGDNLDGIRPRVRGLQFFIQEKDKQKVLPQSNVLSLAVMSSESIDAAILDNFYEKIADFWGVEKTVFLKTAIGKTEADIQAAFEYTKAQVRSGKADRPAGVFIDALRNGYKTVELTKKETAEKKLKNTAVKAQIKQDEQNVLTHKKQNQFEINKKILERLIGTDADFKRELLIAVSENNVIKGKYDSNKTVLENMETAMIAGVIMNLAVGLRPDDFS
jgi:plasmid replication initiation protein